MHSISKYNYMIINHFTQAILRLTGPVHVFKDPKMSMLAERECYTELLNIWMLYLIRLKYGSDVVLLVHNKSPFI